MNILITGFDPFNNAKINPSYEAVKLLPDRIDDKNITKLLIPTSFNRSFLVLKEELIKNDYDAVILVGQAGGRRGITFEKIAINYIHATIKDNDGFLAHDLKIGDGPDGMFSTLPICRMRDYLLENKIEASLSFSAGTFVCNYLMYNTLMYFKDTKVISGFIHVPFSDIQAKELDNKYFSMTIEEISKALELAIKAI